MWRLNQISQKVYFLISSTSSVFFFLVLLKLDLLIGCYGRLSGRNAAVETERQWERRDQLNLKEDQ